MITRFKSGHRAVGGDYYTLPPGLDAKPEAPAVYKCPRSLCAPRNFPWPTEMTPVVNALQIEASEVAQAIAKLASSAHAHRLQPAYPDGEYMHMIHHVVHLV